MITQSFIELLRDMMESRVNQVNTVLPAVVRWYNHEKQTACVVPAVARPMPTDTGGRTYEPIPELLDVPVAFPQAGDFVLHLPLQAGDFVLLVCAQFALDEFLNAGDQHEQQEPADIRQHNLSSAVVMAGFTPKNSRVEGLSATEVLLGKPGGSGVSVGLSKVKIGNLGATMKQAARKGDTVRVTITLPDIVSMGLVAAPMTGNVTATNALVKDGEITSGSSKVDISD